jgi:hypothetical protein
VLENAGKKRTTFLEDFTPAPYSVFRKFSPAICQVESVARCQGASVTAKSPVCKRIVKV